ncbi:response regulator transcription factor [Pelagibacterales bacterium SAG-MED20]|nr:response regulator transcription factor [Pelagibacterales bacterium SAG-MED20]
MFAQSVSIVEFPELYNILKEIKSLFKFNINNYNNSSDFINELNINNLECVESIIIAKKKIDKLVINNKVDKNAILVLEELPIKIQKLVDTINIQLIKKKYNFQSKISIKNYSLNFNSRIVSNKNNELKLTEREIDIILFLSENKSPQSVEILQKKVWGHSFDLETHTVETHIYRLRKKFKDKFSDEDFIISKDVGYSI